MSEIIRPKFTVSWKCADKKQNFQESIRASCLSFSNKKLKIFSTVRSILEFLTRLKPQKNNFNTALKKFILRGGPNVIFFQQKSLAFSFVREKMKGVEEFFGFFDTVISISILKPKFTHTIFSAQPQRTANWKFLHALAVVLNADFVAPTGGQFRTVSRK